MKSHVFLAAIALALCCPGCSGVFKGNAVAEKSVTDFHRLYNDGKLQEIYDRADARFKKASPEKEFFDFMGAVQRKLGKVTRTESAGYNARTFNFTTTVVLIQKTTFEHGEGHEVFTVELDGDKPILLGYNIESKDMMMK